MSQVSSLKAMNFLNEVTLAPDYYQKETKVPMSA